jgi:hypothetical protein
MVQELKRIGRRLGVYCFGVGEDQAVHNYLIRTKALNFAVHASKSDNGIIGTLGYYDRQRIVIDDSANISVDNGEVTPSIIHQYDRFPEFRQHYGRDFLSGA